jgi:hypothetical protein
MKCPSTDNLLKMELMDAHSKVIHGHKLSVQQQYCD